MEELENVDSSKRLFYTACMIVVKEEERENQIYLMTTLAKLINPRIPDDVIKRLLNNKKK